MSKPAASTTDADRKRGGVALVREERDKPSAGREPSGLATAARDNPSIAGADARAPLVSPHMPALVPAQAVLVPLRAPPRPSAGVQLEEPEHEHAENEPEGHELAPRAGLALPRPPPPGAAGTRLQRSSLPELIAAITGRGREEQGGLLVEDDEKTLTSGQMHKSAFMRSLRAEVRRVADEELRRAGRSAADCPYIERMLAYYEDKSAEQLERSIRRYASDTRSMRDARDYVPAIAERLGRGIAEWASTGQMPQGVPDDALAAMAGARNGVVGAVAAIAGLAPQRKVVAGGGDPGRVDAGALLRQLGPGRPLEGATQARMERALGHNFAAVRVHADDHAAALNRDLSARAFTLGPHIAFAPGELQPGTPHGDALLAHELAHVVQQGTGIPIGEVPLGAAGDALEHAADSAAQGAVEHLHGAGEPRPVRAARAGGSMQLRRCSGSKPAVSTTTRRPAVDATASRYSEALALLSDSGPEVHALLALAPLGARSQRVATRQFRASDGTAELRFDLQVSLVDSLEGGATEARFRNPGSEMVTGSIAQGFFAFPMRIEVARAPVVSAEHLAATLYHEGIHMLLFMDEWLPPRDSQRSAFSASYTGYLEAARRAPDWPALITAWSTAIAGGGPVSPEHQEEARAGVDKLLQEKYAFNASDARYGSAQPRTNQEVVDAYLADELHAPAATLATVGRLLRSVFDHVDGERGTIPAFPARPAGARRSP